MKWVKNNVVRNSCTIRKPYEKYFIDRRTYLGIFDFRETFFFFFVNGSFRLQLARALLGNYAPRILLILNTLRIGLMNNDDN
jgi:hypothetical protein